MYYIARELTIKTTVYDIYDNAGYYLGSTNRKAAENIVDYMNRNGFISFEDVKYKLPYLVRLNLITCGVTAWIENYKHKRDGVTVQLDN